MRLVLALSVLTPLLLVSAPAIAEACSCMPSGPPCQAVWESPVLFAGTVIELDQAEGAFSPTRVRFRITEAFRGAERGEIDIHLRGGGGGTCDPPFKLGESWLVYANNRWEGGPGWTTSICSRTRVLNQAREDLAYLRLPRSEQTPTTIVGTVTRRLTDVTHPQYRMETETVGGVTVRATGRGKTFTATTDANGRYRMAVPWGAYYDVAFEPPEGLVVSGGGEALVKAIGCVGVDGHARFDGRVSGVLTGGDGRPVPHFPLSLVPNLRMYVGGFDAWTFTDAKGRFEFSGVQPASYSIAPFQPLWRDVPAAGALINSPIAVGRAARVSAGRLRMSTATNTRLLEIVVVDAAGKPVTDARLSVRRPETSHSLSDLTTDGQGQFAISVIAGQPYLVRADRNGYGPDGYYSESASQLVTANSARTIRLRLAQSR